MSLFVVVGVQGDSVCCSAPWCVEAGVFLAERDQALDWRPTETLAGSARVGCLSASESVHTSTCVYLPPPHFVCAILMERVPRFPPRVFVWCTVATQRIIVIRVHA